MKTIIINNSTKVAIVDDDDYELFGEFASLNFPKQP